MLFFIDSPFSTGGEPSVDDSDIVAMFGMGDDQQTVLPRQTDQQRTIFGG